MLVNAEECRLYRTRTQMNVTWNYNKKPNLSSELKCKVCSVAGHFHLLCLRLHRAEALSDACLTSVCLSVICLSLSLSRISGLSREQRSLGRLKLAQSVVWGKVLKKWKWCPSHTWLECHFQGQKVKGQLVADVLNSQHGGTGDTWRINTKILSTCRGRRHIVAAARLQLV